MDLKNEMRLWALELLVCQLYALEMKRNGNASFALTLIRDQMLSAARTSGFSGVDPATSDLMSAEFESAIDRLFSMTQSNLDVGRGS